MKNTFYFFITVLMVWAIQGCKAQKTDIAEQIVASVTYKKGKGRCVKCEQYTITIMNNGLAKYDGLNSMPMMGASEFQLSKSDQNYIESLLAEVDLNDLDETYRTRVMDKPMMTVVIDGKSVRFQEEVCPKELQDLVAKLESLVPRENRN